MPSPPVDERERGQKRCERSPGGMDDVETENDVDSQRSQVAACAESAVAVETLDGSCDLVFTGICGVS